MIITLLPNHRPFLSWSTTQCNLKLWKRGIHGPFEHSVCNFNRKRKMMEILPQRVGRRARAGVRHTKHILLLLLQDKVSIPGKNYMPNVSTHGERPSQTPGDVTWMVQNTLSALQKHSGFFHKTISAASQMLKYSMKTQLWQPGSNRDPSCLQEATERESVCGFQLQEVISSLHNYNGN